MDRANANPVFLRELSHRLALSMELGDLTLLAVIKTLGPSKLLALPLGSLDAFVRTFADQAALKLRKGEYR